MALNQFTATAEVSTGATTIATLYNAGAGMVMNLTVANEAGGAALNTFKIQTQSTADAPFEDYFGGSDWSSSSDARNIFTSSTKPNTLAAGSTSTANIYVCGVNACRLVATTASGTANITVYVSWARSGGQ